MAKIKYGDKTIAQLRKIGAVATLECANQKMTENLVIEEDLADLSKDNVNEASVLSGVSFHNSLGEEKIGTIATFAGENTNGQWVSPVVEVEELPEIGVKDVIYRKTKNNFCGVGYYFNLIDMLTRCPEFQLFDGTEFQDFYVDNLSDLIGPLISYLIAAGGDAEEFLLYYYLIQCFLQIKDYKVVEILPKTPPLQATDIFDGMGKWTLFYETSTGKLYTYCNAIVGAIVSDVEDEDKIAPQWIDLKELLDLGLDFYFAITKPSVEEEELTRKIVETLSQIQGKAMSKKDCSKSGFYIIEKEYVDYKYNSTDEILEDDLFFGSINVLLIIRAVLQLLLIDDDGGGWGEAVSFKSIIKIAWHSVNKVSAYPPYEDGLVLTSKDNEIAKTGNWLVFHLWYEKSTGRIYTIDDSEWIFIGCDGSWKNKEETPWGEEAVIFTSAANYLDLSSRWLPLLLIEANVFDCYPLAYIHHQPGFYPVYSEDEEIAGPSATLLEAPIVFPAFINSKKPKWISSVDIVPLSALNLSASEVVVQSASASSGSMSSRIGLNNRIKSINSSINFRRGD